MILRSVVRCVVKRGSLVILAASMPALALTACTSSGQPQAQESQNVPPVTTTLTAPTSAASSPSEPASSSAPAVSTSAVASSSSPAPATSSAAATTCTSITVRVIPGGASLGQEIAALQFVNSGKTTCVLVGYPMVILLRSGTQIGQSSQPSSVVQSHRTLAPNAVAESLLHDYSSCQAPLSDTIRVTVPGTTQTYTRPFQLRACILRVDKLGPPS